MTSTRPSTSTFKLLAGLSLAGVMVTAQADIISDLEARYICDETLEDSSGNARDLIIANGLISYAADPLEGFACVFDGATRLKTDDGVLPESATATYAFWINGPAVAGQTLIMQTVNGGTTSNTVNSTDLVPGALRTWGINPTLPFSYRTTAFEPDSTWRHLVITTQGTTGSVEFYLDGQPVTSTLSGSDSTTDLRSTFWLGGRSDTTGLGFAGEMADIRLYSRALSAEDAAELFAQGRPSASPPPPPAASPLAVPTLEFFGLMMLAGLIGAIGLFGFTGLRRS